MPSFQVPLTIMFLFSTNTIWLVHQSHFCNRIYTFLSCNLLRRVFPPNVTFSGYTTVMRFNSYLTPFPAVNCPFLIATKVNNHMTIPTGQYCIAQMVCTRLCAVLLWLYVNCGMYLRIVFKVDSLTNHEIIVLIEIKWDCEIYLA